MTLYENYPIRVYSDSTLKSMTKETLIGAIRCLENNLANAYHRNAVQASYIDFFWEHSSDEVKNKFIKEGGHYVEVKDGALIEY